MTDRELLELAAKAAGIKLEIRHMGAGRYAAAIVGTPSWHSWNPLTDDGDALRLAGKLYLRVKIERHECEVFDDDGCLSSEPISHDDDQPAATRRAIVRAAAEIGKDK